MRRALFLLILLGLLSVGSVADGAAPGRRSVGPVVMPCVGPRTNAIGFRLHPRHCLEYRDNETFSLNIVLMNEIRWRHWGSKRSKAKANLHYCAMGGCVNRSAKIAASGLRSQCDHYSYTQLRVKFSSGAGLPGDVYYLHLPVCRSSL